MSTSPSEFLKWLLVFGVPYGGGGSVTYPITMDKGGTGANLTPVNNSLFYSNATNGALLATPASSVLGSDALGALTWSQTLPSGTQAVSPSTANMVATKAYVDAVAAGLNPAQAVDAASVSELTGYTYDNGVSGVGATLTAPSNGVFQLDGITVPINEPILYKNDITGGGAWNGVYIVTDPGSVSTPAILTRAVYYDDPDNINNTGIIPVILGDVNQQSAWLLVSTVVTIGTSPLTYIQFGQTAGIIPLDKGGTNNNITPSAGGIVYSEALWLDVIAGTATARQMLQSGSSAAPAWSTTTWPATSTINRILYSSAANVIDEIATANSSVLITSAGGIPGWSTTLPSGLTIPSPRITTGIFDANGNGIMGFTPVASAVNYANIQNNTTTNNPKFIAVGTDTNIGIELQGKGNGGAFVFSQTSGSANPAGVRGEVMTNQRLAASAISMTTTSAINVTSVTLSAGPWRITGNATIQTAGGSGSQFVVWVSATSATLPDVSQRNGSTAAANYYGSSSQEIIVNPTTSTTYYLSAYCIFPGTATACGTLTAQRL